MRTHLGTASLTLSLVLAGCAGGAPAGSRGPSLPAAGERPAAPADEAPSVQPAPSPSAADDPTTDLGDAPAGGAAEKEEGAPESGASDLPYARGGTAAAAAPRAAAPRAPTRPAEAKAGSASGAGAASRSEPLKPPAIAASGVRAGEWDDNANYREWQAFLGTQLGLGHVAVDVSQRRFLVVTDSSGQGVPSCDVTVSDAAQRSLTLRTTASGRAILFPRAERLQGRLTATARCQGSSVSASVPLQDADAAVELRLPVARALPGRRTVDVAFVLDTTGSMSEEIEGVKATIRAVAERLEGTGTSVRIGLVEYKDRGDAYVTRAYPMTTDLDGFSDSVAAIRASGGGDTPEAMNEGLAAALEGLDWSERSVARMAFVIADAPPHLDYAGDRSYSLSMRDAARRGIQLFTVSASGMDALGQVVMRQLAQFTGGSSLFVLRGGAGPQSAGGGDPRSSCGGTHESYTSGNLDQLIVGRIRRELAALDAQPLAIAGLRRDENAKPCAERVVIAR
ncbi:MAG: VWA domain-containing protein [Polyangiaceae bacterium]|nr:VWA domain-containing protein [Polyangiaceae bacterium]